MSYSVVRQIGQGGFGLVEEVVNSAGIRLARKSFEPAPYNLPNGILERQEVIERLKKRFVREVKTQALLSGPEILSVVDSDLKHKNPWFVMPLADKTYDQQIRDDLKIGNITIEAVADIMNGLQYLHEMGYVHRDLNPRNILLHENHWKLTDFGAVLPPRGQTITLTENTTIYTELYCSPEQHSEFHNVQPPSDVYSFGCILHDLVSKVPRTPYAQHTADGKIGVIIEKCTDKNPAKRPTIDRLRDVVLEALHEVGGHFKLADEKSEEWVAKLGAIEKWNDEEYEGFLRFFKNLDKQARSDSGESAYVGSLSTPFLTHLNADALEKIALRRDGLSEAIVEDYCDWACDTAFKFGFCDTVGHRLATIYDNGTNADKALAFAALVRLGASHHRWYVMRLALVRCGKDMPEQLSKRLAIELRTDDLVDDLRSCVNAVSWEKKALAPDIRSIL